MYLRHSIYLMYTTSYVLRKTKTTYNLEWREYKFTDWLAGTMHHGVLPACHGGFARG
jgi:hypothetical protein